MSFLFYLIIVQMKEKALDKQVIGFGLILVNVLHWNISIINYQPDNPDKSNFSDKPDKFHNCDKSRAWQYRKTHNSDKTDKHKNLTTQTS